MSVQLTPEEKSLVKDYESMFTNTGGNDIVELIERKNVSVFSNAVVAILQSCCLSQLGMLQQLKKHGLLKEPA